jgi:hypothetical protein
MPKKHDDKPTHADPKSKAQSSSHAHTAAAASTPSTTTFTITPAQFTFLGSLTPLTDAQVAHLRRVSPDVSAALNAEVIQAIHDNPALGGPDRAARITALLAQQGKLVAIDAVLEPLGQLVTNNLLAVNAELGDDVYEALKVAKALEKTQPELARKLQAADDWSKAHHPGHAAAAKPAPVKPKPTT